MFFKTLLSPRCFNVQDVFGCMFEWFLVSEMSQGLELLGKPCGLSFHCGSEWVNIGTSFWPGLLAFVSSLHLACSKCLINGRKITVYVPGTQAFLSSLTFCSFFSPVVAEVQCCIKACYS